LVRAAVQILATQVRDQDILISRVARDQCGRLGVREDEARAVHDHTSTSDPDVRFERGQGRPGRARTYVLTLRLTRRVARAGASASFGLPEARFDPVRVEDRREEPVPHLEPTARSARQAYFDEASMQPVRAAKLDCVAITEVSIERDELIPARI
jgi:hypothetical protein